MATKIGTGANPKTGGDEPTWDDELSAARLPPPDPQSTRPAVNYRHRSVDGFYVRVGRRDASGNARRSYFARYDVKEPGGKKRDNWQLLGLVNVLRYGQALQQATAALERAREARSSGRSLMPTLKQAFDDYLVFKTEVVADAKKLRAATLDDYRRRFNELVPVAWHNTPIDELSAERWSQLRRECTTVRSFETRLRKPVSEARFDGLLRGVISGVYRRQATLHKGLENPVPALRESGVLSTATARHDYIATERLAAVVLRCETELRPSQRDITYIGLLTGWRRQLLVRIPLSRIKRDKRSVEWRDSDPGGPYAEPDGSSFDYPVSDLLWERVFQPRLEQARPGQKYLIESGRRPGQPLDDIRDSLGKLDEVAGCHISAQVLRKTFLTLGPSAAVHQRTLSHLAMHKLSAGAQPTTMGYQKRDFEAMKAGANQYATWFAQQVGWTQEVPQAPAIEGISTDKLAKLQALAEMDPSALDKLLRLAEAMK